MYCIVHFDQPQLIGQIKNRSLLRATINSRSIDKTMICSKCSNYGSNSCRHFPPIRRVGVPDHDRKKKTPERKSLRPVKPTRTPHSLPLWCGHNINWPLHVDDATARIAPTPRHVQHRSPIPMRCVTDPKYSSLTPT